MLRKLSWMLLFILVLSTLVWNVIQWHGLAKKISSLEGKIRETGVTPETVAAGPKGQDLILEMWHKIEETMQDYKQRLREGQQQFSQQQSSWNSLLAELKKSLQEYDKFIAAEGDFWEKQLKNYDKLLARTEERFDLLGQVIEELQTVIADLQNLVAGKEIGLKEPGEEVAAPEEEEERPARRGQKITPQIKGGGEYKTYPPIEEEKEEEEQKQEGGEVIRGTVTGTGEYKTY